MSEEKRQMISLEQLELRRGDLGAGDEILAKEWYKFAIGEGWEESWNESGYEEEEVFRFIGKSDDVHLFSNDCGGFHLSTSTDESFIEDFENIPDADFGVIFERQIQEKVDEEIEGKSEEYDRNDVRENIKAYFVSHKELF